MSEASHFDVAIVGGGPAGSTVGTLLKKYAPDLKVVILEREKFPRDHVGESQLPPISKILDEMGCWEKVEAANFPIKIGATYKWGKSRELWDFEFLPAKTFQDEPRPAKFEGQRQFTAFQVDRAVYDKILLDHAAEQGCDVLEETKVVKIHCQDGKVEGLELANGETVTARYYFDASGHSGLLRRALGIEVENATKLQNIAIWEYWQNADWAIEIGVGGTRVQVMSLDYGWIWFIPLSPTRTSVGLVIPADYYKKSGMRPEELYAKALDDEPRIKDLMRNAKAENNLSTTKDWSFISKQHCGENWFLVGESAGFADPILAAGLTIAHVGAMEAVCTLLELERGKIDPKWLREVFEDRANSRIMNHIRFAEYWYTANSQFKDLQEFTAEIAADNGYDMTPGEAWRWIAQGGFITDSASIGAAGFGISQVRALNNLITDQPDESVLSKNNHFVLDLDGATWKERPYYANGTVGKYATWERGNRVLPQVGALAMVVDLLKESPRLSDLLMKMRTLATEKAGDATFMETFIMAIPESLEAMILDGWVKASHDPRYPLVSPPKQNVGIYWNQDQVVAG